MACSDLPPKDQGVQVIHHGIAVAARSRRKHEVRSPLKHRVAPWAGGYTTFHQIMEEIRKEWRNDIVKNMMWVIVDWFWMLIFYFLLWKHSMMNVCFKKKYMETNDPNMWKTQFCAWCSVTLPVSPWFFLTPRESVDWWKLQYLGPRHGFEENTNGFEENTNGFEETTNGFEETTKN